MSEEELDVGELAMRVGLERSEVSRKARAIGCVRACRCFHGVLYVCHTRR
ncbi:hypothetical protein [Agrobacterium vitis]|nr:hypothetical protein [Agrobacterium vitis]NSY25225.1 hypothetical protein [Agrobacterium vitis]NTA24252.1 hypothetical protein [Agrobacterium vitis]